MCPHKGPQRNGGGVVAQNSWCYVLFLQEHPTHESAQHAGEYIRENQWREKKREGKGRGENKLWVGQRSGHTPTHSRCLWTNTDVGERREQPAWHPDQHWLLWNASVHLQVKLNVKNNSNMKSFFCCLFFTVNLLLYCLATICLVRHAMYCFSEKVGPPGNAIHFRA